MGVVNKLYLLLFRQACECLCFDILVQFGGSLWYAHIRFEQCHPYSA